MTSSSRSLFVSAILLGASALALYMATLGPSSSGLTQTFVFIAGLLSMSFLSSLSRFAMSSGSRLAVGSMQLDFDPHVARIALDDVITAEFHELDNRPAWERSTEALMAEDPTLALAKIRIEIEREVRRIAFEASLPTHMSLSGLLTGLSKLHILPSPLQRILHDILPALNRAVHGMEIEREQAQEVLLLGGDLISFLRQTDGKVASPDGKTSAAPAS